MIGKIYKTRYPELTFREIEKDLWRIFSQFEGDKSPGCVGPHYHSKLELLSDLDRYAKECGL